MRYYVSDKNHPMGFTEVSESEYIAIFGDETIRPYTSKVYYGELSIDEVPIELQTSVLSAVEERVRRWGLFDDAVDIEGIGYTYTESEEYIED